MQKVWHIGTAYCITTQALQFINLNFSIFILLRVNKLQTIPSLFHIIRTLVCSESRFALVSGVVRRAGVVVCGGGGSSCRGAAVSCSSSC